MSTPTRISVDLITAAAMVDTTDEVLRKAIHAGHLKAKRQSRNAAGDGVGKYLIKVTDLEAWVDGLVDA